MTKVSKIATFVFCSQRKASLFENLPNSARAFMVSVICVVGTFFFWFTAQKGADPRLAEGLIPIFAAMAVIAFFIGIIMAGYERAAHSRSSEGSGGATGFLGVIAAIANILSIVTFLKDCSSGR